MRKRQGRRAWIGKVLLLSGILVSGSGPASAVAVAPDASPQKATAIEQARQAEAAGRLEEAVGQLERAYELGGDPELLFYLGELTGRLGQSVRALRLYRTYVARNPGGKNHAAAERRITVLEGHAPSSEDSSATVPQFLTIPPASVNRSAAVPAVASVTPPATPPAPVYSSGGGPSAAAKALVPKPSSPAALDLDAAAGLVPGPAPTSGPAAGLTAVSSRSPSPPIPRWVPWAGLTATVGLAIAATVSAISASARYDQLRTSCGATSAGCSEGQIDDLRSSAHRTTILWVGAGIMAAATGAGFYLDTREAGFSGVWRF